MAGAETSQEDMRKQASQIWSMLDDMAENNPASYKKFIDKHVGEAKEQMKPPEPHMCLQTTLRESNETSPVFINVFEWQKVPAPKTDEDPIPIMAGTLYEDCDEEGRHKLISVAFNPKVLQDFGIHSPLAAERRMLINLAIDYLQDVQKLNVSRNYTLLNKGHTCKGRVDKARQNLSRRFESSDTKFESDLEEVEKSFGPLDSACKDSLLNKLTNIAVETDDKPNFPGAPKILPRTDSESRKEKGTGKSKMIQDMDFEETPRTPKYKLDVKGAETENEKPRRMVVRINLPDVMSVAQCELDISERDLRLKVEEMYKLTLDFPEAIKESEAHAKFSRKSSCLTLTLPTVKMVDAAPS